MTEHELREQVNNYQPNKYVLEALKTVAVAATVGPSASGKTTVMYRAIASWPNVHLILDETSRPPRHHEQQNIDYLFRSREEIIKDMQDGALVQVAIGPNGDLYCTHLRGYPRGGIGAIALIPAAVEQFRNLPFSSFVAAFIVPENYDRWQEWLANQARYSTWTPQQKQKRLEEARESYEFALSDNQIRFVLNDTIEAASDRFMQVARGQDPDDEQKARTIAQTNLERLGHEIST